MSVEEAQGWVTRHLPRVTSLGALTSPASVSSSVKWGSAPAGQVEIHRASVFSQQKTSWLILKGEADTRTNSPDLDSQSLSLSSGTDRGPPQTAPGDNFYSREWFF